MRLLVRRISSSRSSTRIDGGTTRTGRIACSSEKVVAVTPERQQVLEVDHAQHVVEMVAIDHQPGMLRALHGRDHLAQAAVDRHALDVGARHHDVVDPQLAEAQRVADQLAPLLAEGGRPLLLGLGDQLLERLAHPAGFGLAAPGEIAHPAHEAVEERWLRRLPLGQLPHGRGRRAVGIGDAEPGQQLDLARLHRLRLGVGLVIEAEQMQRAVDQEVGQMVGQRLALPRPPRARLVSNATTTSPRSRGPARCPPSPGRRRGRTARWSAGPCRDSRG